MSLMKLRPEQRVRPIRLLVQDDELARLVGDLAAEHQDGVADRGVAIARAVGGHAPAREVGAGGDLHRCIAQFAQVAQIGVGVDACLLEGALPHPEAAGANEVRDGPILAVDEVLGLAGCVQRAVELLQVLLERIDLVDDVQEVQLGRTQRVDENVWRVASLDRCGQLLDHVARASVGLDVRVIKRIVLLCRELLDLGLDQGVVVGVEIARLDDLQLAVDLGRGERGCCLSRCRSRRRRGGGCRGRCCSGCGRRSGGRGGWSGGRLGGCRRRGWRRGGCGRRGGAAVGAGVAADWQAADTLMAAADRKLKRRIVRRVSRRSVQPDAFGESSSMPIRLHPRGPVGPFGRIINAPCRRVNSSTTF